ncbi:MULTISPECIES: alpha/beta fold hydrolase BchO [unclassified Roseitalea]|uniref:alpha/beta fold hydrolase BchO n=1 Tax=unclassified Roseitalea TaxID=2639107 RepID=UPI00273D84C4|nr:MULTISPECIES: alpha/beta fold hydrolase BchO [unclassified Roseitalea]
MTAPTPAEPPAHWPDLAATWPNAEHSRFLRAGNLTWHIQRMGADTAPACLLVHGTGASTHSYRDLMPQLADRFDVLAMDLPGHGFTTGARGKALTLPGMAAELAIVLDGLSFRPAIAVGHSAGAAILIEMALNGSIDPAAIVGLNAALEPIEGNALLSPLAKALFLNPFTAQTVAFQARHTNLPRRLLERTGSELDEAGIGQYETLMRMPDHVAGALGMMANWDLKPLRARMHTLQTPLTLVVNEDDPMVPARVSRQAARQTNSASVLSLAKGGHVAHESDPRQFSEIIEKIATDAGVLTTPANAR